jgi:hypothetical protein
MFFQADRPISSIDNDFVQADARRASIEGAPFTSGYP